MNNNTNIHIGEMSIDVVRQRRAIESQSMQMEKDIQENLKTYFERTQKDKISFETPYKLRESKLYSNSYNIHSVEFDGIECILLCDDMFGTSKNIKLAQLSVITQAMLFDYIMAELSKNIVYVVLEERYDPELATTTTIIGTFKRLKKAQECMQKRIVVAQIQFPEIWEEMAKENKNNFIDNDKSNEYNICTSQYIYNIKIVEQEIDY